MMMAREQHVITRLQVDFKGSKGANEALGIAAVSLYCLRLCTRDRW